MVIIKEKINSIFICGGFVKSFLFFLFLPGVGNLQAQELLKGQIIVDSLQEFSVHIINITQHTGTVNSASGSFKIKVNENDTLWITSVQYEKAEFIINDSILQKKFIEVNLKEVVIILDDVNISDIELSGNLNADIGIMEISGLRSPKLSAGEINRSEFYTKIPSSSVYPDNLAFEQNRFNEGKEFFDLKINLDLIGNPFRKKDRSNAESNSNNFGLISKKIRDQFNDDFFKLTLGIEERDIMDFLFDLNKEVKNPKVLLSYNSLALTDLLISHSYIYKGRRAGG